MSSEKGLESIQISNRVQLIVYLSPELGLDARELAKFVADQLGEWRGGGNERLVQGIAVLES